MRFMTREAAAAFIMEERGVPITPNGLRDHASKGRGPKYSIINGRALYKPSDLLAWVDAQAAKPVTRRRADSRAAAGA